MQPSTVILVYSYSHIKPIEACPGNYVNFREQNGMI